MKSSNIYLAEQIRQMDESCGIDSEKLMLSAAKQLYAFLVSENRHKGKICIVCGKGNNGGDGYALAYLLQTHGFFPNVCAIEAPKAPLTIKFCDKYIKAGGTVSDYNIIANGSFDTIIDCMFGFSFKGQLKDKYAKATKMINNSGSYIFAVDLPSGLTADSDALPQLAIKADACCTFTAYKCATASYPAKENCGKVFVADIGIPQEIIESHKPYGYTDGKLFFKNLPIRHENSHKGTYGPLLAVCGNEEMTGAAFLACNAAYRTGTGLVKLYTAKEALNVLRTMMPEAIIKEIPNPEDVLSDKHKALLMGCGCGRSHDEIIIELLKASMVPTVLDADGINCIAGNIELYSSVSCPLIVTPHPGEMARLVGTTIDIINSNRISVAKSFAEKYGVITVLKGCSTVVSAPDGRLYVNQSGNSGLAKGGSGDVLAGIIASLCAQGVEPFNAAVLGVYIHGAAADSLAESKGVYAILPSELAEEAGKILYFG